MTFRTHNLFLGALCEALILQLSNWEGNSLGVADFRPKDERASFLAAAWHLNLLLNLRLKGSVKLKYMTMVRTFELVKFT